MTSSLSEPRQSLADLLLAAGGAAPTVCEGWDARDLVVHLLVREGRPDAAVGHAAGALPGIGQRLAAHTARVEADLAAEPFDVLVQRFRSGPPRWSLFAVPAVERAANGQEFFIHGEDVRRGTGSWQPEPAPAELRASLWSALRWQARLAYRRSPVGVVLVVPDGPRTVARRPAGPGGESVVLTGAPEELVLHSSGRDRVADVEVTGSDQAVAAFAATRKA